MFISMNWIRDYVDLSGLDLDKLIHQFSLSTAEVENEIFYKGSDLSGVVVAEVKSVENHPESKKLHLLKVDIGEDEPRQIVAGLAKFYSPEELVDRKVCVVANLQPAKLFGTLSQGMILATGESGALLSPDENGKVGERIQ